MIEINNLTNFAVDKKFLSTVAKKVLKGENRERENISIAFVSSAEIKKSNQKYRKKNKPTDVLSFKLDEKDCLGEIVICPEVVKKNGDKIAEMLVHGIPYKELIFKEGDLVGLDLGMKYKGLFTDHAVTVGVGKISDAAQKLLAVTEECLRLGIIAAQPAAPVK